MQGVRIPRAAFARRRAGKPASPWKSHRDNAPASSPIRPIGRILQKVMSSTGWLIARSSTMPTEVSFTAMSNDPIRHNTSCYASFPASLCLCLFLTDHILSSARQLEAQHPRASLSKMGFKHRTARSIRRGSALQAAEAESQRVLTLMLGATSYSAPARQIDWPRKLAVLVWFRTPNTALSPNRATDGLLPFFRSDLTQLGRPFMAGFFVAGECCSMLAI